METERTVQNKLNGRTYGTNTETVICTSGWLHAFCPLSSCVLADQGQLGQRQHLGRGGHSTRQVSSHTYLPGTWLAGSMVHQVGSMSRQTNPPGSACETAHIARRSHGQDHGSWEGRFLQVVLTGGTRLGESLIRRLVELKSRPVLDERVDSRTSQPAGSFDPFITWAGYCCPSAR